MKQYRRNNTIDRKSNFCYEFSEVFDNYTCRYIPTEKAEKGVAGLNTVILGYKESLERLNGIIAKMGNKIGGMWLPAVSFYLALKAQAKVLEYLNDEHLNYGLAWDEDISFPSLPSLVGDVGSYIKYFNPQGELRALLESFCGWTLFSEEEIFCYCGKRFSKGRKVRLEIMMNHVLEVQESSVIVKQFLGVRSDDMKHLKHHYNFKKPSQRVDNLFLIYICRNKITDNGSLEIEYLNSEQAEQFNIPVFQSRILELI